MPLASVTEVKKCLQSDKRCPMKDLGEQPYTLSDAQRNLRSGVVRREAFSVMRAVEWDRKRPAERSRARAVKELKETIAWGERLLREFCQQDGPGKSTAVAILRSELARKRLKLAALRGGYLD